ncbi:MAG: 16S rRNA (guanine(966)-N(2))-methyltransferase RsmD [Anaerolineales bacterium]|nr:16S rRNA (guanine(966)-N(2))-methyltransferase RsmD [Anaerolineales bacterium]MCS7246830.1 16S rRNA (guanine(966)-N(2))-methyltransferase RsmD [Anaerolineales bacterium]MDW8160640.1 16S rRNA (guanine(966)-N(2))-methyltransferase RsmD [Anaerolineales bacterium]MDW8446115.1 16S rRNA (guanine(966)-N(2))-methyltransferase RsmD [Anaerolineales bacterium]
MRVISGKAKGRRLKAVPGETTRPITDRTKEALFNILGADIENASFLDCFAGTGSVGIEALSRGASFVRFYDLNRKAIQTIQENLQLTGLVQNAQVIQADVLRELQKPPDRSFDYIYIAPPQYQGLWSKTLQILDQNLGWLSADGWCIVQIHPLEYENLTEHSLIRHLVEFDRRKYGSTLLVFYERR